MSDAEARRDAECSVRICDHEHPQNETEFVIPNTRKARVRNLLFLATHPARML